MMFGDVMMSTLAGLTGHGGFTLYAKEKEDVHLLFHKNTQTYGFFTKGKFFLVSDDVMEAFLMYKDDLVQIENPYFDEKHLNTNQTKVIKSFKPSELQYDMFLSQNPELFL